jgi:hypothetical protein
MTSDNEIVLLVVKWVSQALIYEEFPHQALFGEELGERSKHIL